MPCPYATPLSEDEDGLTASDAASSPLLTEKAAFSEARLKCPAFAHDAPCPFRGGNDPDSLREIMKTVPPSHFSRRVSSSSDGDSMDDGGEEGAAATPFRVAMEHVHRVSIEGRARGDSFVIEGGCPFKSFHKNISENGNTAANLARAMEEFSLAAIIARMAAPGLGDEEDEREHDSISNSNTQEGISSATRSASNQHPRPSLMLSHALKVRKTVVATSQKPF